MEKSAKNFSLKNIPPVDGKQSASIVAWERNNYEQLRNIPLKYIVNVIITEQKQKANYGKEWGEYLVKLYNVSNERMKWKSK